MYHIIGTFLIYFYVDVVRLDPAWVGTGFLFSYGVWNSVNDPIAGYISDRTRTRWGRRIPFILFFTPLMMLLFVLLWSPPVGGKPLTTPNSIEIFLYFVFIVVAFELIYTFVTVGWNALFPEMFQSLEERSEVSVYRQVAAMIGLIIGFVAGPLIISYFTDVFGVFNGWMLTGILIAFISGCAFLVSLLGSREKKEFSARGTLPIREAFRVTLFNRSFLTASSCILMTSWVWSLLSAVSPFVVVYMLGGSIADVTIISAPIFFVGILFYPLWRKVCIRFGTKRTLIVSTSLSVLFLVLFIIFADNITKGLLLMCLYGFANSGITLTRELLMPDVIDEDEVKTGFRREGVYLGVTTFVDRFALALTGGSTALIFSLSGFTPGVSQPPSVIFTMRLLIMMIFLIALLGFLVSAYFYPLGPERVSEIREKLRELRAREK